MPLAKGLLPGYHRLGVLMGARGNRSRSRTALLADLGNPDSRRRRHAVTGLATLGAREAAPAIVPLLADAHVGVRAAAALALGMLEAREAVPELVRLLADPEWAVRAQAAWSLGTLADPAALEPLLGCLADRRGRCGPWPALPWASWRCPGRR